MRTRRPSPEHQEAVSRRLAQLSAELAASRLEPVPGDEGWGGGPDDADDGWGEHTRVATARPALTVVPELLPEPLPEPPHLSGLASGPTPQLAPEVPRPGRHASRRRLAPGRLLADLLPETLRGPVGLGPAHLAVVAVLVAVGLAVTCWWVVRGDVEPAPTPVEAAAGGPVVTPEASPAALEAPAAAGADAPTGGSVTVDVAGKVRRPGIAVLDAGSRVVDAIEAAGGARHGVDLSSLNLARVLVDGEQVLVGGAAAPAAAAVPGSAAAPAGTLVNLNTATPAELELLPEVGPVTAQAIAAWRDEHGGFTAVEELLEVDGIGDKTLATISPHVTV